MNKNIKLVSPKGKAMWAKVLRPETKFNPDGIFSVDLIVTGEDAVKFKDRIDLEMNKQFNATVEEFKNKGKANEAKRVKLADSPYSEEEDGSIKFKFKTKAKITGKDGTVYNQKVNLFDSKGKECEVEIWNGSEVKVAFEVVPFFTSLIGAGVSLRLKAIQIINLVEGHSSGASSFGFDVEEGFSKEDIKPDVEEMVDDPFGIVTTPLSTEQDF
jgi:hypothetical protein